MPYGLNYRGTVKRQLDWLLRVARMRASFRSVARFCIDSIGQQNVTMRLATVRPWNVRYFRLAGG